jgi:hypothetical protein
LRRSRSANRLHAASIEYNSWRSDSRHNKHKSLSTQKLRPKARRKFNNIKLLSALQYGSSAKLLEIRKFLFYEYLATNSTRSNSLVNVEVFQRYLFFFGEVYSFLPRVTFIFRVIGCLVKSGKCLLFLLTGFDGQAVRGHSHRKVLAGRIRSQVLIKRSKTGKLKYLIPYL